MRLAAKLTLVFSLAILALMGAYTYLQTRQEVVLFDIDVRRGKFFGRGAAAAFAEVWRTEGEARAMRLVAEADVANPTNRLRWVWLEAPVGAPQATVLTATERAALRGGESVVVERREGEDHYRYTYVPMRAPGLPAAGLELREDLTQERTYLRTSHRAMAGAAVGIAGVAGALALGIGFWFVGRPVRRLRDSARRIARGDLAARVELRQHDEIGDLAHEINAMCLQLDETQRRLAEEMDARVAALEQLRHADRLATVGRLASGVAHELGTPLSVVDLRSKMIAAAPPGDEHVAQHARVIGEQAKRMTQIIRQLLDFARRRPARLGPTDLRAVVARTLDLLGPVVKRGGVRVELDQPPHPVLVHADQAQLEQALSNLVVNAVQAMPGGGRLVARVETRDVRPPADHGGAPGAYPCVVVQDEGTGIAPEDVGRVFEPFFTTKPIGEGTGLGLAVTHGIVSEHGGWLDVESAPGQGTCVRMFLPGVADAPRAAVGGP